MLLILAVNLRKLKPKEYPLSLILLTAGVMVGGAGGGVVLLPGFVRE